MFDMLFWLVANFYLFIFLCQRMYLFISINYVMSTMESISKNDQIKFHSHAKVLT